MLGGVDVAIRQEHLNEGVNRVLKIAGVDERVRLPEKHDKWEATVHRVLCLVEPSAGREHVCF